MAAIFQFFHTGQHWYSVSVNTPKTRDPNFGGLVIWKFSIWSILKKWQPFSNFFIMANADIPFPLHLENQRPKLLGGSVIWKFSIWSILKKWQPFFIFFIMANADILFLSNFLLVQFSKFSVGSVFPITHPRFHYNINAWLCLKHFAWWPFCTQKTGDTNFPSIQFSELFCWFSFPCHPS